MVYFYFHWYASCYRGKVYWGKVHLQVDCNGVRGGPLGDHGSPWILPSYRLCMYGRPIYLGLDGTFIHNAFMTFPLQSPTTNAGRTQLESTKGMDVGMA